MLSNKLAISTISLGQHPSHSLDHKIKAAAQAGFAGIEVVCSDLEAFSRVQNVSSIEGAKVVKAICDDARLEILALQLAFACQTAKGSTLDGNSQNPSRTVSASSIPIQARCQ